MKLTSQDLLNLNIIDGIISEPNGGAHRDKELILNNVKTSIKNFLLEFKEMSKDEIVNHRKQKFLSIGRNKGFRSKVDLSENLAMKEKYFDKIIFKIKKFKLQLLILLGAFFIGLMFYFYL